MSDQLFDQIKDFILKKSMRGCSWCKGVEFSLCEGFYLIQECDYVDGNILPTGDGICTIRLYCKNCGKLELFSLNIIKSIIEKEKCN